MKDGWDGNEVNNEAAFKAWFAVEEHAALSR